jgi:hypothetical protein
MAGVKGRSGGLNRRSVAEHRLAGTYRKDRHGKPDVSPDTPARLEVLRELYASHVERHRAMSRQLATLGQKQVVLAQRVARALRQEAALISSLTMQLDRLERLAASNDEPDPETWLDRLTEFDPVPETRSAT